ncbi:hypothetical protein Rhe02_63670 [Rhizocola hellebori]|uniref:Lipoprotein LpqB beta-propeller domain-containing protein n=1 Tax=Rhizocola hellebori TaxID=1392758 RepID=A0A8J3QEV6_9ACTN|nr:hypothetical protein [Rhizocola hellebori]GIH08300.1 hypothetical protein Rhe02_63670 [Rhizocola hellebori]
MRTIGRIAVALAVAAAGCTTPARPAAPPADRAPVIIDADQYGVIFLDVAAVRYVGVRRDGTVAWRVPAGDRDPAPVMCLDRCPDAVLSGSAASLISPAMPDPEPVLMVDGRAHPIATLTAPKRWVLTARSADDLVVHTGDRNGQWWLEIRHGANTERVSVGGPRTSWREDADGRYGLAVSAAGAVTPGPTGAGPAYEARWFERDDAGWRVTGSPVQVAGGTACLHPDGSQALLIGQRPVLLDRTGAQTPVTDLERAGTCALTRAGGIVADLTRAVSGSRSALRVFDAAGKVTWSAETAQPVAVVADPAGARVGYVAGDSLIEIDPLTGAVLRTTGQTRAARYDGSGGVVVVHTDLSVAWLDAVGR